MCSLVMNVADSMADIQPLSPDRVKFALDLLRPLRLLTLLPLVLVIFAVPLGHTPIHHII